MAGDFDVCLASFANKMGLLHNMLFAYRRSCTPEEREVADALWRAIQKIMEVANSCRYCVTQLHMDGKRADYVRFTPSHLVLRTLDGHKYEVRITDPIAQQIMQKLLA